MKPFVSFVRKEFYHILRDYRSLLFLLGMPVIQIILFGFAISNEVRNARIAVIDSSNDAVTRMLIDRLDAGDLFQVVRIDPSAAHVDAIFRRGEADVVITFSPEFGDRIRRGDATAAVQLTADATDPNQATTIVNYISAIFNEYQREVNRDNHLGLQIVPQVKMLYNPQMKSAYNFVPGVMAMILMLICAMMTSISIVRERETGTMEVLLASPLRSSTVIIAKMIPYFVLSVLNLATVLLLSVYLLDVPMSGSLAWVVVVSLLFIILSLALGLLISTMVDTQLAAMLVSGMVLMLPFFLLSGMIFPIESMPDVMRHLSVLMPARWYISAMRKLMIQGVEVAYVVKEMGVLLLMIGVLIGGSFLKYKTRIN